MNPRLLIRQVAMNQKNTVMIMMKTKMRTRMTKIMAKMMLMKTITKKIVQ